MADSPGFDAGNLGVVRALRPVALGSGRAGILRYWGITLCDMLDCCSLALIWEPFASPLKIGAGSVVLAGLALFASLRILRDHPRMAVVLLLMRLGVIAAVTTLMFGPSRELAQAPLLERPRLNVLVDTSESMLTADCAGRSRIEFVGEELLNPAMVRELQTVFDVRIEGFDATIRPLDLSELHAAPERLATGDSTLLSDSVTRTLGRLNGGDAGEALLVISDGHDTEDVSMGRAVTHARVKGIPVFTIGVGGDNSSVDATLLAVPAQEAMLPGESGEILLKIYQSGLEGEVAVATLRNGSEVQRTTLPLGQEQVVETRFSIQQDEPGQYEYEVTLEPIAGETELANNSQTVFIEVMKRKMRVLLLEGEPFWDTKFLAQSLRKDEQIELTQITQVGDLRQEKIVTRRTGSPPGVPRTADDWNDYDVVILGKGLDRLLDEAAANSLAGFIRDGGHLVLARGPAWRTESPAGMGLAAAMEVLMPVVWTGQTVEATAFELTPSGSTSAWFAVSKMGTDVENAFQRLPGFERMQSISRVKGGTLVLARAHGPAAGEGPPAIVRMAYGRGQVVGVLGEGLWKWGLLPPNLQDLRGFYDTFWSNLIRWLALGGDFPPGQQVSLQLSRTSSRLGDDLTIDVAYRHPPLGGAEPQLTVTNPEGSQQAIVLHPLPGQSPRYSATLKPEQPGVYRVTVNAPGMEPAVLTKRFNVYAINLERLRTSANHLSLHMLAEHSGGRKFNSADLSELLVSLQRHQQSLMSPPIRESVWDRAWVMTLLLLWAGGEWLLRRAAGLW